MHGRNWLDNALQDFRYAIRQLRNKPGFACTAAFVLALGIAAIVSIFGLVEAALIKPLPYRDQAMFLRQGLLLTLLGIASGVVVAAGFSRLMFSLLLGVTPFAPVTCGTTSAVLLMTAMAATDVPARRAAATDPMETLRGE